MKILQYLAPSVADAVEQNSHKVEELRLRADKPARIKVGQVWYYIGRTLQKEKNGAYVSTDIEIENTLKKICENSIYTFERQLISGFLTLSDGTRIGVGGSVSMEGDAVRCFNSYKSLCIRIPHFVWSHGKQLYSHMEKAPKSCLIVGQPSAGKTTTLRELSCLLSAKFNVVLIDERGEISLCERFSENSTNVDVLLFCDKRYGFENAVRSLSPDVIACDELTPFDYSHIKLAMNSGVTVFASMHGGDISAVEVLRQQGVEFDFYCVLNNNYQNTPRLYQKNLKEIIL